MDTKLKGDIAEQAVILLALKQGWGVLRPIGDRLPYNLVLDINGSFLKIQVKNAWFDETQQNYMVDNRRTKTNRRIMIREKYRESDFDFAIIFLEEIQIFYIMPVQVFASYGGGITLVETEKGNENPSQPITVRLGIYLNQIFNRS